MDNERKTCTVCNIEKDVSEFRCIKVKYSLKYCRVCENERKAREKRERYATPDGKAKILADNLKNKTPKDVTNKKFRDKYNNDPEFKKKIRDKIMADKMNDPEKYRQRRHDYHQRNKEKIRQKDREKKKLNPSLKLRGNIKARLNEFLRNRNSVKGGVSFLKHCGYTIKELVASLESKFEPWMNWDNYGAWEKYTDKWQVDHVIPQSFFDFDFLTDPEFKLCWALDNLRPYSAVDNFSDSGRFSYFGEYRKFSKIVQDLQSYVNNPITDEKLEDVIRYLRSINTSNSTDSCNMNWSGVQFLDSIFSHRYSSKSADKQSLVEASKDQFRILNSIVYLIISGRPFSIHGVFTMLKYITRTPGHFFPAAAYTVMKKHSDPNLPFLDPFIGWGGRLLAALAYGYKEIYSCDLQSASVNSAGRLLKDFLSLPPESTPSGVPDITLSCVDALDFMKPFDRNIGFILTSPPFHGSEDYGVESKSSSDSWIPEFVIPFVASIKKSLVTGGKCALHLKDVRGASAFSAYQSSRYFPE